MKKCLTPIKIILDQNKCVEYLNLHQEPYTTGINKDLYQVSKLKVDTEDTCFQIYKQQNNQTIQDKKSVIVECQQKAKKKIWKDKLSSSEPNILITKLCRILDQASILKEKRFKPFWTQESNEISKKLWLPTKIDCVDLVLSSSKESSKSTVKGQSWFSISKKHPLKKNSLMTSFQSSQFSLPDSMDSEVTQSNDKSENNLFKTLKFSLSPTSDEIKKLEMLRHQSKWYYNATRTIVYQHYGHDKILNKKKYSNTEVRDLMRKYHYTEDDDGHLCFKEFVFDENKNDIPIPEWWKGQVHSRTPRGAVNKFVSSLNSAISNFNNGNISKFEMKFQSNKRLTDYINFEDKEFPAFIKKIKSKYWFTDKKGKKNHISFSDVDCKKRGCEIIYEKQTKRYFLHYPVDIDWFPSKDRRNDSQVKYVDKGDRLISLDPGVRKFLVGYDPKGFSVFIGEGASLKLSALLLEIDSLVSKDNPDKENPYLLYKKVKNMVSELHWKTISFLTENYDTIILPEFKVSEMIRGRNGRKLSKMTKRLMCMFSFYSFRQKLQYKCNVYGKKLIIVDESYTSCTCGLCGTINKTKGKEILCCISCGLEIDRDVSGSRNILIKNTSLRCD